MCHPRQCPPPRQRPPPPPPGTLTRGGWVQGGDAGLHVRQEGRLDILTRGCVGGDAAAWRHGRRGVPGQRRAGVPRQRPARLQRHRAPSASGRDGIDPTTTPPTAGTHPVNGRLAVGGEANALPIELVSWLWEEEGPRGVAPGDSRHPSPPIPLMPTVSPSVPCNRVQRCPRQRGTGLCPAAACGQGRRGTGQRAGGRWGRTGHQLQRTARPGGTAAPHIPAGPGRSVPAGRGDRDGTPQTPPVRMLTSLEYARLRPWRGSCWPGGGPG